MLKKLTLALTAASAVSVSSLAGAETVQSPIGELDVSMNATLASDYIFRGISQTQGDPAIQGGLDVSHESGLYVGMWASNVDFGGEASSEFDFYVGYAGNISEELSYNLGWIKYEYPGDGDEDLNFSEYYASLSAHGFTVGTAYSNDFPGFGKNGRSDSTLYTYVGYEYSLPYDIGLALQYGNYDFKDPAFTDKNGKTSDSYNNWSIGLSKNWAGLDFGLTYTDTNLSSSECKDFIGKSNYCDANFVVSVSKTL